MWQVYKVLCTKICGSTNYGDRGQFLAEDADGEYTDLCLNSSFYPDSLHRSVNFIIYKNQDNYINLKLYCVSGHEMRPYSLSVKHSA